MAGRLRTTLSAESLRVPGSYVRAALDEQAATAAQSSAAEPICPMLRQRRMPLVVLIAHPPRLRPRRAFWRALPNPLLPGRQANASAALAAF